MDKQIIDLSKKNSRRRLLKRVAALMCTVVLLITMNGLKRNANTLERIPSCGMREHQHSSDCYDSSGALVCGKTEHVHTDACYQGGPSDADRTDYLKISADAVEGFVDEFGAIELADLQLDADLALNDSLVVNDVPAYEEPVAVENPVYELGNGAMLSAILANTSIRLEDVVDVGVVDYDGTQAGLLHIEKVKGDYQIKTATDFDWVDLAVILADEMKTVKLTGGRVTGGKRQSEEAAAPAIDEHTEEREQPLEEDASVIKQQPEVDQPLEEEQVTWEAGPVEEAAPVSWEQPADVIGQSAEEQEQSAEKEAAPVTWEQPADVIGQPVDEQPADEESVEDQPADEQGEQPAEDQPADEQGEQSVEKQPADEESVEEQAADEQGEQPAEDQPTDEEGEQPAEDQPADEEGERPAEDQPADEQGEESVGEQPADEQSEQPAEDQPADEQGEKPVDEQPADEQGEESVGEQPADEQGEQPVEEQPADEQGEQPVDEQPADEQDEEPVDDQPADEQGEQPANEQPADEQGKQPVDEQPIEGQSEQLADDQPADEQDEESVDEQPIEEQPGSPQILYPAQTFSGSARNVNVSVTAPEGAFPEGTVMTVKAVYDQDTIGDIRDTVNDDFTEIKSVRAIDITFTYNGVEIEPLVPISVVMSGPEIKEEQAAVVVHVDDEGSSEVVDTSSNSKVAVEMPATSDPEGVQSAIENTVAGQSAEEHTSEQIEADASAVAFESDSFSIYAYVVTETIETHYIDASGSSWKITVGYGQEAGIPNGANLRVSEVTGVAAEECLAQTAEMLENQRITLARFFDITILDSEGNEVQPEKAVEVRVEMEGNDDTVKAVHFDEEGLEVLDAQTTNGGVTFDAESFSVYGIVYTVDFEYNGIKWSFPGKGSRALREVLKALGIEAEEITAADLVRTETVGEYGEKDLYLTQEEGEWYINSDAAFDDTYELSVVADGETYKIRVTDDPSGTGDLSQLATIIAAVKTENNTSVEGTTVTVNDTLNITLDFTMKNDAEAKLYQSWEYDLSRMCGDNSPFTGIYGSSGNLSDGNDILGTYEIDAANNKIIITPDPDKIADLDNISGRILIHATVNTATNTTNNTSEIHFPGATSSTVITVQGKAVNSSKYVGESSSTINKQGTTSNPVVVDVVDLGDGRYKLYYRIEFNTTTKPTSLTLTDALSGGQELLEDTLKIGYLNGQVWNVDLTETSSVTTSPSGFSIDMHDIFDGQHPHYNWSSLDAKTWYVVTYETIMDKDDIESVENHTAYENLKFCRQDNTVTFNYDDDASLTNTKETHVRPEFDRKISIYKMAYSDKHNHNETGNNGSVPVSEKDDSGNYRIWFRSRATVYSPTKVLKMTDSYSGINIEQDSLEIEINDGDWAKIPADYVTFSNGSFVVDVYAYMVANESTLSDYLVTIDNQTAIKANTKIKLRYSGLVSESSLGESLTNTAAWDWDHTDRQETITVTPTKGDSYYSVYKTAEYADTEVHIPDNAAVTPGTEVQFSLTVMKQYQNGEYIDLAGQTVTDEIYDFITGTPEEIWIFDSSKAPVAVLTDYDQDGTYSVFQGNGTDRASDWSATANIEYDWANKKDIYQQRLLFTLTFPQTRVGGGNYADAYTICYKVTVDTDDPNSPYYGTKDAYNRATFGGQSVQKKIIIDYGRTPDIQKEFVSWDETNNTATWTVHVDVPDGGLVGTTIIRDRYKHGGFDRYYSYMPDTLTVTDMTVTTDGCTKITDASNATQNQYTVIIDSGNGVMTFPAGLNKDIDITVVTALPSGRVLTEQEEYFAKNTVELEVGSFTVSDDAYASYDNYNRDYSITKDGTFAYESQTIDGVYGEYPVVTWTVVLNPDQTKLSDDFEPYFYDRVPDGMRPFGNMRIDVVPYNSARNETAKNSYGNNVSWGSNTYALNSNATEIGPINLVDVYKAGQDELYCPSGISGIKYTLTYKTTLTDAKLAEVLSSYSSHDFTNHAEVRKTENGEADKTASDTVTYQYKGLITKIDKSEEHTQLLEYEVDINKDALTINSGKWLKMSDNINTDVTILLSTVKVYEVTSGGLVDITKAEPAQCYISYSDDTRRLDVQVPDGKYIRVKFSVIPNAGSQQHSYVNTVTLSGVEFSQHSEVTKNHIADSAGFLTGTSNAVNIKKFDKYNVTKTLPGAKFEFYKCTIDRTTGEITGITKVKQGVTNNRGQLSFAPVEADTLYYWVETQAPENYSIATSTPHYFVAYQELTDTNMAAVRFGNLPVETQTALRAAFPDDPVMLGATADTRIFVKAHGPRNDAERELYENLHYFYLQWGGTYHNNDWHIDLAAQVNEANQQEAWALDDLVTAYYNGTRTIASIKSGYSWQVDNIPDSVATAQLEATKTMLGRGMSEGEFTFYLYDITDDHDIHWLQTKTNSTGDAGVAQTILFDKLSFAVPGTYKYRVYEKQGADPDVNYDEAVYEAVITVARDENSGSSTYGQLVASEPVITKKANASAATGETAPAISFVNEYNKPGAIVLPGTKTLIGRDMTAREFTFKVIETITVDDGNGGTTTEERVVSTGTNRAALEGTPGSIVFSPITYTTSDAGRHTYTVTEDTSSLPDNVNQTGTASFTVVVDVAVENGVVTPTIASTSEPVAFTNKYVVVNATKKWINQDGAEFWPANVTFKLVKKDGNTYSAVSKPSYYANDPNWTDQITVTKSNPTATWEHLDPLPDGQDYFAIEYEIEGVDDITRDSSVILGDGLTKGPATTFTMNGVVYDVTGGTSTNGASTIINAARANVTYEKHWVNIADPSGLTIKVQIRRYDRDTGEEDTTFALRSHEFLLDGVADATATTLTEQETTYGSHTYTFQEGVGWTATWTGLPLSGWLANGDAQEYRYVVNEVGVLRSGTDVSDEFVAIEGTDGRSTTNYCNKQDVPFSKVWSPSEPTGAWSITAKLQVSEKLISVEGEPSTGSWSAFADYDPATTITIGKDASGNLLDGVVDVGGKPTVTVTDLPKYHYDEFNGRLYELRFSAAEVEYRGYNTTVETDDTTGAVTITNTEATSMDVTVNKEWVLLSGSGTNSNKVIVVLKDSNGDPVTTNAAGTPIVEDAQGKVELNSDNDFTFTWSGVSIDEYTIQEVQVLNSSNTDITDKFSTTINGTAAREAAVAPDGAVNGIANIVNIEVNEEKTQVRVEKKWYNGDTELTAQQAADEGLTARVKLVEYRTPKVGTTIHFVDRSNSGISKDDLTVGNGEVKISTTNSCGISVSTIKDALDWQTTDGQDGYIEGNPWNSYYNLPFTVASQGDIYVYFWSNPGTVSVPVYTPADPVVTTGPFNTGKTLTLTAPNYKGTFYNLNTTKEIGGTTYILSYAVEEIAPTSGYTIEYSTDGTNWSSTCSAVGGAGTKALYVKNTTATGSLKITKAVQLNGAGTTDACTNGTYTFVVYKSDGTTLATKKDGSAITSPLQITVTAGVPFPSELVVDGLELGSYIVKETASTNNGITLDSQKTVTVSEGTITTAATAAFVNNYETTQVELTKTWDDSADPSHRPTAQQFQEKVHLKVGNNTITAATAGYAAMTTNVVDNQNNTYTVTWSNLPKYNNGAAINYSVVEDADLSDYYTNGTVTYNSTSGKWEVTNTLKPGWLKITKAVANESAATTQTFTFTVKLTTGGTTAYTGGVKVQSEGGSETATTPNANGEVTVTTAGSGEAFIKDLPAGTQYEVTEASVDGWKIASSSGLTGTISACAESEATVTNTEVTGIQAKKTWNGSDTWPAGMSVTFKVKQFKGETEQEGFTTTVAVNGNDTEAIISDQQTVTWNNLPKCYLDQNNVRQEYIYQVVETGVEYNNAQLATGYRTAYTVTGEGTGTNGLVTIDNTPKKTRVNVSKAWEGDIETDRPDAISYTLSATAGGAALAYGDLGLNSQAELTVIGEKTATPAYSAAWDNLPKYAADGTKIDYTVTEGDVADYYLKSTADNEGEVEWTWTFTNKRVSINIPGTKAMEYRNLTAEDVFSFEISATAGAPMPATTTVENNTTTGAFTFGPICYTKADMADVIAESPAQGVTTATKDFVYTISEVKPANAAAGLKADVVYDTTVYTARVTLTYTYATGDITASGPVFTEPNPAGGDPINKTAITFVNRDITDFDFTKRWLNASQNIDTIWPTESDGTTKKTITVTLKRKLEGHEGTDDPYDSFEQVYTLSPDSITANASYPMTRPDSNVFSFKISNLEKYGRLTINGVEYTGEWVYMMVETPVPGYIAPQYLNAQGQNMNGQVAMDGYTIQNAIITVALPATGGLGTTLYYAAGATLLLLALALLVRRKAHDE